MTKATYDNSARGAHYVWSRKCIAVLCLGSSLGPLKLLSIFHKVIPQHQFVSSVRLCSISGAVVQVPGYRQQIY